MSGHDTIQLIKGSSENLAGGYTVFDSIDHCPFFCEELKKQPHIGVGYTAIAIASQVVTTSVIYTTLVSVKVMHFEAEPYNAIVTLYRDLEGMYHMTSIERVYIL
ncbi:MAG: hypothetical protein LBH58_05715 [Tannerellaceae bacterium]|nr:hypothetical protein [Tannerellaceae bacterium]